MKEKQRSVWIIQCGILLAIFAVIFLTDSTVTTMAEIKRSEQTLCYIIDPGHGGVDGGATSCTGKPESAYNLEIGLRLNDLMQLLGCTTKMIRTEDISVYTKGETIGEKKVSDLKQRVKLCNETENAILLSIHQNTFPETSCSGPQVFYAKTQGSRELAENMQVNLAAISGKNNRSAKKSQGIYLMEQIRCRGILIECGFLSNPEEEAALRDPAYQKLLCCVICCAAVSMEST